MIYILLVTLAEMNVFLLRVNSVFEITACPLDIQTKAIDLLNREPT